MKAQWTKRKFPPMYYQILTLKEDMKYLRATIPPNLFDKKLKCRLGTIDGILSSMLLDFAKGK